MQKMRQENEAAFFKKALYEVKANGLQLSLPSLSIVLNLANKAKYLNL